MSSSERTIDLKPLQQRIVSALQTDQNQLVSLVQEIETIRERIAANRGKLELIAELYDRYGQGAQWTSSDDEVSAPLADTPAGPALPPADRSGGGGDQGSTYGPQSPIRRSSASHSVM